MLCDSDHLHSQRNRKERIYINLKQNMHLAPMFKLHIWRVYTDIFFLEGLEVVGGVWPVKATCFFVRLGGSTGGNETHVERLFPLKLNKRDQKSGRTSHQRT